MKQEPISESMAVGLLLALAGGILDAYSYLNRGEVFATAETGNIVQLSIHLSRGEWGDAFHYLLPISAFTLGVITAEAIRRRVEGRAGRLQWQQPILLAECAALVVVAYSVLVWLVVMAAPGMLMGIFTTEEAVIQAGIPAIRTYFALFIFMSLQLAGQSVFTGLGKARQAIFFSLLRKAFINAPLTVILPVFFGTRGVFIAEAVSQLLGGAACFTTMYLTVYRPLGRRTR